MSKQLGAICAAANAFFGKDLGHYPRDNEPETRLEATKIISDIRAQLSQLTFPTIDDAKYHLDEIKGSYNEVKLATEYQDQKTARLLTILAFLTAAAGAVFSKVLDTYPLPPFQGWWTMEALLPVVYALFGIYMLFVSVGALISFHAMQTRFLTPKESDTVSEKLRSLLFFKFIYVTDPTAWGKQFLLSPKDLLTEYVKHYIVETYLIAAKTSDKVRYLEPAQRLLQWAIKVLILWIISLAVVVYSVPRNNGKMPPTSSQEQSVSTSQKTSASTETNLPPNVLANAKNMAPPEKK